MDRTRASQIGNRVIYPDSRMNQAQSKITWQRPPTDCGLANRVRPAFAGGRTDRLALPSRIRSHDRWSWASMLVTLFGALWFLITLPFRLVFWVIAWLGRLTGAALGFALMVVGIALLAGPLYIIGIPMFLVGLVVTLRCLE